MSTRARGGTGWGGTWRRSAQGAKQRVFPSFSASPALQPAGLGAGLRGQTAQPAGLAASAKESTSKPRGRGAAQRVAAAGWGRCKWVSPPAQQAACMGQCANIRTRTLLPTSSTGSGLPLGSCTFVSISFFHWHKPPPHVMQENTHGKRTANRPTYALHSSKGLGARHIEYQQGTEGVLVVNLSRAQRFSFTRRRVQARPITRQRTR